MAKTIKIDFFMIFILRFNKRLSGKKIFHADLKKDLSWFEQIINIKSAQICVICVKKNHFNPLICGFI